MKEFQYKQIKIILYFLITTIGFSFIVWNKNDKNIDIEKKYEISKIYNVKEYNEKFKPFIECKSKFVKVTEKGIVVKRKKFTPFTYKVLKKHSVSYYKQCDD